MKHVVFTLLFLGVFGVTLTAKAQGRTRPN